MKQVPALAVTCACHTPYPDGPAPTRGRLVVSRAAESVSERTARYRRPKLRKSRGLRSVPQLTLLSTTTHAIPPYPPWRYPSVHGRSYRASIHHVIVLLSHSTLQNYNINEAKIRTSSL
jgi:hypothetical protein